MGATREEHEDGRVELAVDVAERVDSEQEVKMELVQVLRIMEGLQL